MNVISGNYFLVIFSLIKQPLYVSQGISDICLNHLIGNCLIILDDLLVFSDQDSNKVKVKKTFPADKDW